MLALRITGRVTTVCLLGFGALLSFVACVYLTGRSPVFSFFMFPLRGWELLAGSLLAVGILPDARRGLLANAVSLVGLALILYAVFSYSEATLFPGVAAAVPVLGACCMIWTGQAGLGGRILAFGPFVAIGVISYSLYMWHWPIIAFTRIVFPGEFNVLQQMALFCLSMFAAGLSWRFIEMPFRTTSGVFRSRWSVFAGTGSAMAVSLLGAAVIVASHGLPARLSDRNLAIAEVARDKMATQGSCNPDIVLTTLRGRARGLCRMGARTQDGPRVLLWGDSHLGAWYRFWTRPCGNSELRRMGTDWQDARSLLSWNALKSTKRAVVPLRRPCARFLSETPPRSIRFS